MSDNLREAIEALADKWATTPGAYVQHGSSLAAAWAKATDSLREVLAAHPVPTPAEPDAGEGLTEADVGALLSAVFHALGTHALSGHTDELERRLRVAVERIVAARVAEVHANLRGGTQ